MILETSKPGVFAAGDFRFGSVKRIASSVGEGAIVIRCRKFIAEMSAQEALKKAS